MNTILNNHLYRICIIIFLYVCWSYLITYTVFENFIIRQAISIFILIYTFFYIFINRIVLRVEYWEWLPFLLYVICGGLINGLINSSIFWIICMMLLAIAPYSKFYLHIPLRLATSFGIIMIIGIGVQIFFPSFYYSRIVNIFTTSDEILSWYGHTGFAGFTYQLGMTGGMLLIAEGAAYSLYKSDLISNKKKYILSFLIILIVVGVFMTGKRTFCFLSVSLPFLTDYLQQRNSSKKFFIMLLCIFIMYLGFYFLSNYPELFSEIKGLNRLAEAISGIREGEDVTSNRSSLYELAWKAFEKEPIFGVGVGNFIVVTNAYTAVHNSYLRILCEQGIVGFILYVFPLTMCLYKSIKVAKQQLRINIYMTFSLYIQLFYVLYSFTGNTTSDLWGYVLYFVAIAIMLSVKYNIVKVL